MAFHADCSDWSAISGVDLSADARIIAPVTSLLNPIAASLASLPADAASGRACLQGGRIRMPASQEVPLRQYRHALRLMAHPLAFSLLVFERPKGATAEHRVARGIRPHAAGTKHHRAASRRLVARAPGQARARGGRLADPY